MTKLFVIINVILISQTLYVSGGILDWFRSKPKWISKIDKYPLVEAFQPHGLRVSIGDVEGMELFGFHGKLNHCFSRGDNGTFFGYAIEPQNGRWAFIDDTLQLRMGDALHFWFQVRLHGEEYSFPKEVHIVNNLIPRPHNLHVFAHGAPHHDAHHDAHPEPHHEPKSHPEMCPCDQVNVLNNFASTSSMFPAPVSPPVVETKPLIQEDLACKAQADSLTEVVLEMLKDQMSHSNLMLTGPTAQSGNAVLDVSKIFSVMELFDLIGKIKSASYTDCGIYFEMSSVVDKKRILVRAAIDLQNSNNKFVEPEETKCNQETSGGDLDVRNQNDNVVSRVG